MDLTPDDLFMGIGMVAGLIARTRAAERQVAAERAWALLRRAFTA